MTTEHGDEHHIDLEVPEVSDKFIRNAVAGVAIAFGLLFAIGWLPRHLNYSQTVSENQNLLTAPPNVLVEKPTRSTNESHVTLPAGIEPLQRTSIFPRSNGYLNKLLVDIGDKVTAGQLLAEIDTPEVAAELLQARASLEEARTALNKAQLDADLASTTFKRFEGIGKTGGIAMQQIDEKRAAYQQALAVLAGSKAKVTEVQASVQRLTDMEEFSRVVAPFPGTIATRNYDVGALLSPTNATANKELFRLDRTDIVRTFVNVPQAYSTQIKVEQPAEFKVQNYPGRSFKGTVARSGGSLDPDTRTLRVEVDFPNSGGELLAGMYGEVSLPTTSVGTLLVPTSALIFDAGGLRAAVVNDGKVSLRKIMIGRDYGSTMEVLDGIQEGEDVVTNPGMRIAEGVEVHVVTKDKPPS